MTARYTLGWPRNRRLLYMVGKGGRGGVRACRNWLPHSSIVIRVICPLLSSQDVIGFLTHMSVAVNQSVSPRLDTWIKLDQVKLNLVSQLLLLIAKQKDLVRRTYEVVSKWTLRVYAWNEMSKEVRFRYILAWAGTTCPWPEKAERPWMLMCQSAQ